MHARPEWLRALRAAATAAAIGATLLTPSAAIAAMSAATTSAQASAPHSARMAEDTVSWAVTPSFVDGEEIRSSFFVESEPGQVVKDSVRVQNFSTEELELTIYASDAINAESGVLDVLPADQDSVDVGAWITLESAQLRIPPGKRVNVPFAIRIPEDAEAGDHTGGIVTSYLAPGTDAGGQTVQVDQRLVSRVAVRIDGELAPALSISEVNASYGGTANPAGRGSMDVSYTVTNTGNVRLGAEQTLNVGGPLGLTGRTATLDAMPELLPGNSVRLSASVPGIWPTIRSSAEVELRPIPTRPGDTFPELTAASASAGTWALPWSFLLLMLLVAGATMAFILNQRRLTQRAHGRVAAAVEAKLALHRVVTEVEVPTLVDITPTRHAAPVNIGAGLFAPAGAPTQAHLDDRARDQAATWVLPPIHPDASPPVPVTSAGAGYQPMTVEPPVFAAPPAAPSPASPTGAGYRSLAPTTAAGLARGVDTDSHEHPEMK